jgi:hypothetical protein
LRREDGKDQVFTNLNQVFTMIDQAYTDLNQVTHLNQVQFRANCIQAECLKLPPTTILLENLPPMTMYVSNNSLLVRAKYVHSRANLGRQLIVFICPEGLVVVF